MRQKIQINSIFFFKILIIVITLTGLSISCGNFPQQKDNALKDARETYARALDYSKTDNMEALSKAKQTLDKAENANDIEDVKHFAYLAKQQAQIAITIAERQQLGRLERLDKREFKPQPKPIRQPTIKNRQLEEKLLQWQKHQIGSLMITLNNVFETNKINLSTQAHNDIETVAKFLKQHPKLKILIEAHTNNVGTHQHNWGLSERYATSVKFAFMEYGISSKRMKIKNFSEKPVVRHYSKEEHQQNRRVEIMVFKNPVNGE